MTMSNADSYEPSMRGGHAADSYAAEMRGQAHGDAYDIGAATGDPVAGNGSQAAFELRDSGKGTGYVGPDSGPRHVDVGD